MTDVPALTTLNIIIEADLHWLLAGERLVKLVYLRNIQALIYSFAPNILFALVDKITKVGGE